MPFPEGDPFARHVHGFNPNDPRHYVSADIVHVEEDDHQFQFWVEMPGFRAQDVEVEVCNTPPVRDLPSGCTVKWTGRRMRGKEEAVKSGRSKLGAFVDCDHLEANLSRGILRMSAPLLAKRDDDTTNNRVPRSIPIERVD